MAAVASFGPLLAARTATFVFAVLALAALLFWLGRRRAYVFRIHVEGGKIRESVGNVPQRFLDDVEQLCRFWQIDRGWIKGTRRDRRIVISVGGGIEQQHAQVFRNAWNHPVG